MGDYFSTAASAFRASGVHKSQTLKAQSTKFIITGVLSAVIDISITWILQILLEVLGGTGARTVGFIFGTLAAYLLNRRWTFQAEGSSRRFLSVVLLYGITYVVNVGLYRWGFGFLDDSLGWNATLSLVVAFVIAQGTATVINFFVQRLVIFRRPRGVREVESS